MPKKPSTPASQEALSQRIRELEQEVAAYRQILDYVPLAVLYKGPQSEVIFANQRMRAFFAMTCPSRSMQQNQD